jgi:hypothetical protein
MCGGVVEAMIFLPIATGRRIITYTCDEKLAKLSR